MAYTALVNMDGGYHGKPGVSGWAVCGYPSATVAEKGRSWAELR